MCVRLDGKIVVCPEGERTVGTASREKPDDGIPRGKLGSLWRQAAINPAFFRFLQWWRAPGNLGRRNSRLKWMNHADYINDVGWKKKSRNCFQRGIHTVTYIVKCVGAEKNVLHETRMPEDRDSSPSE